MLRAVAEKLPELAGLAAAWYKGATTHGVHLPEGRVETVRAERGLDQVWVPVGAVECIGALIIWRGR